MLAKWKRKKNSRPSSPGAEDVAGHTSSGVRLAGATKAIGRGVRRYLGGGASSDNIQGQKTPPIRGPGQEAPPPPIQTRTGVAHDSLSVHDNGLSPWEEAIIAVPEITDDSAKRTTEGQVHKDFIDDLIMEIRKYNKDINNRRWFRINDKGEKVFFVEKVIFQLERYAHIGDVAIQHNPNVVALVWAGFRFLLQAGSAYTRDMQRVMEGIELVVRSLCECHFFERLYLGTRLELGDELRKSLVKFYISVLRFLVYGKDYLSKSTADRVQASFFSELSRLMDDMQTLLGDVKSKVNTIHMQWEERRHDDISDQLAQIRQVITTLEAPPDNAELKDTVEKLYEDVEGEAMRHALSPIGVLSHMWITGKRRLDILQWISDVPFGDHHTFNSQRRQEDTGHWLLENKSFLEWRNSSDSSILWMRGDAGSGKTLLASFIIDEFERVARSSNEHIMAYFYCDYKEPARTTSNGHIPSLVAEMYRRREQKGFSSGKLSVSECTELIVGLAGKYRDMTLVIDGIDECDRKTRPELFRAINDISKADSRVKIIMTGRYDTDIERMFSRARKHYLTAKDNTTDITRYVETQVEKRCDSASLDTMQVILNGVVPPDLRQEIIETLCEKSNGMFMWVHLQILALCEEDTQGGVRQALRELPEDLNATYDQILKRISERGPRSERIANFVLRWLIYAESVCSTQTIIQAIAIRPNLSELDNDLLQLEISHILGACQNLVVHDVVLGNFQFAHFSVKEYLQRHPRFADVETSQRMIAEVCLTAHVYHHSAESGKRRKVEALLRYSAGHWPAHIRLSGDAGFHALRPLWIDFVGSAEACVIWLRELSSIETDRWDLGGFSRDLLPPPLLWVMCCVQLLPIAKYLLQRGDDPNCVNHDGRTSLFYAAVRDHHEVARMLIDHESVDINKTNNYSHTPISQALYNNSTAVAAMLLEREDLRVNEVGFECATALTAGITDNSVDSVRLLLKREDVAVNGVAGQPIALYPLWHAVKCRSVDALEALLERQDLVMIRDPLKDNHTPLSWAKSLGYSDIALLLSRRFGSETEPKAPPDDLMGTHPGATREETED
ncbi:hypothetical protein DFP73DRAFT_634605 [Morchella snyderi]|nr:hypothetical protein DFP73DRAFT_634605 [Morchella snyderi]